MAKILVVDDDSATRLLLKRDLKLEGHEVELAKDGEEGLESAIAFKPALIICDWVMPNLDGVEVCRRIKSDADLFATFFILLTSKVDLDDRVQGLDAGADDFLSKPVDPAELLARVRAGLRLYQSQLQLSESNRQLSKTLRDLQKTQAQLIQSEKMSSLGQMVAGIAHEINNPVTFIDGNLSHGAKYLDELINFLHHYQKHYPHPVPEMQELAEEIELEYLMKDFPKLLHSMKRGAERIREIVLSLRNFSRLDEAQMKAVDIHEGIDNTVSILQHRLGGIELMKEYREFPRVECYPAEMNQVFLHILNNAIDAVRQIHEDTGQIAIRTFPRHDGWVEIRISDNGVGIPRGLVSKVFNPFFTTKPVGAGKGLGLTISYQIVVEKHGGKLECVSQLGEGTELAIAIPIRQHRPPHSPSDSTPDR